MSLRYIQIRGNYISIADFAAAAQFVSTTV